MKKTAAKKLMLSRETLKSLDLGRVSGGLTQVACQSDGACPSDVLTCGTINCTYGSLKC